MGKVKREINRYLNELSILNSLTKIDVIERKAHLYDILSKYPEVAEVIPLLIAERGKRGKIDIFAPEIEDFIIFEFERSKVNKDTIPQIVEFCVKTGIIDLFQEVKDIYDYLFGVEVGIDTNARKNRSGKIFESMCQQKIKRLIGNKYKLINNDRNFSLYPAIGNANRGKTHDIVVYKNDTPVLIVECNFYNVSGSKPVSIAESYIKMQEVARESNIEFLWVTDGPGWKEMEEPLLRGMKDIDWVLNFRMLDLIGKILR